MNSAALLVGVAVVGIAGGIGSNAIGVRVAELTRPSAVEVRPEVSSPTPAESGHPGATPQPTPASTPAAVTPAPRPTPTFEPRGPGDRAVLGLDALPDVLFARITGYERALAVIEDSPWIGHGLGTLVHVGYQFGAGRFATPGMLPNVDNAYLTVAMKAGIVGVVAFMAMIAWPLVRVIRHGRHQLHRFWIPAWLGLLALTLTQSFAVIGHSPFALGLLIVAAEGMRRRRTR